MKGDIKSIKAASNECILPTDCINRNVKNEVLKYWKTHDLKKGPVGGIKSNPKSIGYLYRFTVCALRFWLHATPHTWVF